jgi:hypothetical protein
MLRDIEEGRAASKSPHLTFGYFLSISQLSTDIIQNSAVGNFSSKREETKTKAARCFFSDVFSLPVHFGIRCNLLLLFTFCQVCLLVKETAEIETGMAAVLGKYKAKTRFGMEK